MRNLMNLKNTMRVDYEETVTSGTQTTLIAIGIISTFFKLRPNIVRQLHMSCNLDSVHFLQEVYKILTGNDFQNEGYSKFHCIFAVKNFCAKRKNYNKIYQIVNRISLTWNTLA